MYNLSLVLFTALAQAAVGMVLLFLFLPVRATNTIASDNIICDRLSRPGGFALAVALVLFGLGVLFSFLHLSDPLISFYSITNLKTSWLSREILFVGLFGLSTLVFFFIRNRALNVLAALFGLGLIYVMSRVYINAPALFWNSYLTLAVFLSSTLLLGSATLLATGALRMRDKTMVDRRAFWLPLVVVIAAGLRLVTGLLQLVNGFEAPVRIDLFLVHLIGVSLGLVAMFIALQKDCGIGRSGSAYAGMVLVAAIIFWAAEICGRVMFYDAFESLAM